MKQRFILAVYAWLTCLGYAMADNMIISNITVPQGGSAELTIGYNFTSTSDKVGFTFSLALPEGLSLLTDGDGEPVYVKGENISKLSITCAGLGNFGGLPSSETATIKGIEGPLLTLTLVADASLAVGSTHTVNVTKTTFQERVDGSVKDIIIPDFSFIVTIGEPADTRTILNETSTTALEAATDVNVRVLRSIKANEWSTICLPFAMSEAQVKAAFGNDVELADFNDYEYDDTKETINVKFQDVTAIAANHPYIIKVSKNVSEFTADGVDIDPEDEPTINFGTRRKPRAIVGTYVANTVIDNGCLFLSGNKFWYSVGTTKTKAFRAYFNFNDLLPDFEENYAEARVYMVFADDETTGVDDVRCKKEKVRCDVYDLQGRKVQKPSKGLYIINGRKEVVR